MSTPATSTWSRLRHHAATAVAWLLVLLAAGVAELWMEQLWVTNGRVESVTLAWLNPKTSTARLVAITSGSGAIDVRLARMTPPVFVAQTGFIAHSGRSKDAVIWPQLTPYTRAFTLGPFGFWSGSYADALVSGSEYAVIFPHWFILLLLLLWPANRGMGSLKLRRRRRMGLCPHCGYDLRASPERCPECGTARVNDETRNSNAERIPKPE